MNSHSTLCLIEVSNSQLPMFGCGFSYRLGLAVLIPSTSFATPHTVTKFFEPSLDIAYQGQWSHVPPPSIHFNSHTMPVQQQYQPRQPESGTQKDRYGTHSSTPVQNEGNAQIVRPSFNQSGSTNSNTKVSNNAKNSRHVGSGYRDHRSGPPEHRVGYQGKSNKMKQIYVAKVPASGKPATTS